MSERNDNIVIRGIRLLFLPFPLASVVSMAMLELTDRLLRPDRSNLQSGEAGEYIGQFVLLVLIGLLQLLVGIPSLVALDSRRSGLATYVGTATAVALTLSFCTAAVLRAPQFGETLGWMFSRVLLFFGIPLFTGYLLAFYMRRHRETNVV